MNIPKFKPGEVIDLRYSRDTMPDRIRINMVYQKFGLTEWTYEVLSEKHNKIMYMREPQIDSMKSKKTAKCYENPLVQKMYKDGFRFCGNSKANTAYNRANSMINANYIKHIVLCDAIGTNGEVIEGSLGLWVQYNTVIDDNTADGSIRIIK